MAIRIVASAALLVGLCGAQDTPDAPAASKSLRGDARWAKNASAVAGDVAPPPTTSNYTYMATTTRYGLNPFTSCDMNSGQLVAGTDYYPVASAQAMQNMFPGGEGECCRCGRAGSGTGGATTAAMGCGTCAKGRFIRQLPRGYYIWTPKEAEIFHKEFNIVVVDICPHIDNPIWCPTTPSETNDFSVHNHFDFAATPPHFDNFYFEFTPTECSDEMKARISAMSSCHP
mmetsp:Transcript_53030/g.152819  ORF Transcript_53030/g.152819 Transcript_53030/m.152819 type:complete len:229 (+) Transcript_53030:76-762(+)|eukprot:CAMPEP_0176051858 /NCGR_PEP_ID=MMETSP0120_2-20121206/25782_1 /TAXON_ID=160619 /ORGANISM="Kryptoperidinium foliaceum, Strain CCMP 1326" /LENGTH=228 /DNA_ID=CAMNT_0017385297 /DNA_START=45 /DNA_END=731 /DNA_ORIENTATION=-